MARYPQRWLFIVNPNSGHMRSRPATADTIRSFMRDRNLDATLVFTEAAGHAAQLAATAARTRMDCVVSVGGDGTMNEIASALVGCEDTSLGLIPLGSGNGLARELGIPLDLRRALDWLLRGVNGRIDTATIGGHAFFCAAGTGLDADVAERFNRRKSRGFAAYVVETAKELLSTSPLRYEVRTDEGYIGGEKASLLVVANAAQFGNKAMIAPGARLDDGLLDFVAVPPLSVGNLISLPILLFTGRLFRSKKVRHLRIKSAEIRRQPGGPFHTDGEVRQATDSLNCRVLPRSLLVLR